MLRSKSGSNKCTKCLHGCRIQNNTVQTSMRRVREYVLRPGCNHYVQTCSHIRIIVKRTLQDCNHEPTHTQGELLPLCAKPRSRWGSCIRGERPQGLICLLIKPATSTRQVSLNNFHHSQQEKWLTQQQQSRQPQQPSRQPRRPPPPPPRSRSRSRLRSLPRRRQR